MQNPVDCTPIWWDYTKVYPLVLEELAASGEIDLAIVTVTDVAATLSDLASALATWSARQQSMPIVVYWGARHRDHDNMMIIERAFGPCYQSTSEAVRGAAALAAG